MANVEHWSKRLHDALSNKQAPSYDLLEEAVNELLIERNRTTDILKDMSSKLGRMAFARMQGNTDEALAILDEVVKNHVQVQVINAAPAVVH